MMHTEEQLRNLGVRDIDTSGAKLYSFAVKLEEGESFVVAYTSTLRATNAAAGCCNKRRILDMQEAFELKRCNVDGTNFITLTKKKKMDLVRLALVAKVAPDYVELSPDGSDELTRMVRQMLEDGFSIERVCTEAGVEEEFARSVVAEVKAIKKAETSDCKVVNKQLSATDEQIMLDLLADNAPILWDEETKTGIWYFGGAKAKAEKEFLLQHAYERCPDEWKEEVMV